MAAVDYFLKIDGVSGESQADGHVGEIEVESFSWGARQPSTIQAGGGGGAGRVSMQDFHFTMPAGKSSPKLMQACASGQHLAQAVLVALRGGGDRPQPFLKYRLMGRDTRVSRAVYTAACRARYVTSRVVRRLKRAVRRGERRTFFHSKWGA